MYFEDKMDRDWMGSFGPSNQIDANVNLLEWQRGRIVWGEEK